ncbi:MAG: sigma-70 family RNA polymerase sigma factor [Candidatus Dormibacteraeota bacterium]|uniref:Sigma-70 family RNA polymerase sigma factor n=1 Tax=Candidatus Amunia macphersoniae TaxID=3127014 RepID=A0A934N8I9_9BACT|nr:sigma-70 family RNA polymerase sigma factor [Candidatus Dormibacteraeota bacterium]
MDESDLVVRAAHGDEHAYEQLVTRHSDLAFRLAYLLTGSAPEAEEAAQDGFLAAYRALPRFREGAPFRPWLLRIVANAARNHRRAMGRRAGVQLRLADTLGRGDAAPSPETEVEAAEERGALLRAVASLSDADRQVISCRYFLELDVAETAAALGCAQGTVKSRLARALGRVRERLGPEVDER